MIRLFKSRLLLPGVLIIACTGLAWMISGRLDASPYANRFETIRSAEVTAISPLPPESAFVMPAIATFVATVERPLFAHTRRPPEKAEIVEDPISKFPLDLVLTGIIFSATKRIVLATPKTGKGVFQLTEGAHHQGWTVTKIAPSEVVFRRDNAEEHLKLVYDRPVAAQERRRVRSLRTEG